MNLDDILAIGDSAINRIKDKQFEGEIYFDKTYSSSIGLERGQTKLANIIDLLSYAIRIKKGNKISFVTSTNLDKINDIIDEALSSIKLSQPDEHQEFVHPSATKPSRNDYYDKKILDITNEEMIDTIKTMNGFSDGVEYLQSFSASYQKNDTKRVILNTNGVVCADEQTTFGLSANCSLRKEDITGIGFDSDFDHKYKSIDLEKLSLKAINEAQSQIIKEPFETGDHTVILHPYTTSELLGWTLPPAVAGDNILRKTSPFIDKIGETIASETFSIKDNPKILTGLNSNFDDEGSVRTEAFPVIEKGVLKNYIHDARSAKAMNTETTSNGYRWQRYDGFNYKANITVVPKTFEIQSGSESYKDLIRDTQNGLFLKYVIGAHSASVANGNFSVVAFSANIIKNGEVCKSPKKAMLPGSMPDLIKKVTRVSKEVKLDLNDWNYSVTAPYMMIDKMKVIG